MLWKSLTDDYRFKTKIKFKKGINLLVGDNRSGKSTVIDSVRLLLQENEYSREGIKENDFYHSIDDKEVADKYVEEYY